MAKKLLPVALLGLLMAGCGTTTVTNLTPKRTFRNENGFYPIEAALNSTQQTLRWDSVKAEVNVEKDFYPMHPTPLMTNRWETLIPVPPGNNVVYYRFKFDYKNNAFGTGPKASTMMTPYYRLQIIDK